jgi:hypothetical protein
MPTVPKPDRVFIIGLVVLFGSNLLFDHVLPAFVWTLAFALVVLAFGISRRARKIPGSSFILLGGVLVALGVAEWAGMTIPRVVRLIIVGLWFVVRPLVDRTLR